MAQENTFEIEKAMARLEEITKELEDPAVTLKESLDIYAEGVKLVNACKENLADIEKEMIVLNKDEFSDEIEEANDLWYMPEDIEDELPFT